MPQIDFYTHASDKLRTVCLLSHKALNSGQRALIYLSNAEQAQALDVLLWEYPPTAFLPHCRSDQTEAADSPLVLSYPGLPLPILPLLINLHSECLAQFESFQRVLEVVGSDETDSQSGRQRYKAYRDAGYQPGHFDLRK